MSVTPRTPLGPIDEKIRVLRERGLSARAISTSLDVLEGWRITENQVKYRCDQLGWHRGGRPHPALGRPHPSKRGEGL
jgi:hypothetical protein